MTCLSQTVGEQVSHVVLDLFHQAESFLKLCFRFATEAADEVAGEGHSRHQLPHVLHQFEVGLSGVASSHALQHQAAATLGRQVEAAAYVGSVPDQV